jgi:hypothetical protein
MNMRKKARAVFAGTTLSVALAGCTDQPVTGPSEAPSPWDAGIVVVDGALVPPGSGSYEGFPAGVHWTTSETWTDASQSRLWEPVPESVIVTHEGLEWVWASHYAHKDSRKIAIGHEGFGFATAEQWALRPPVSAFRNPDKCASPWFAYFLDNCNWDDPGLDDIFHDVPGFGSTYGSAPAGVAGPTSGNHGSPMWEFGETWLVREAPTNQPPDVDDAEASIGVLWPPNHKMVEISIVGVTDPDGDDVNITITGISDSEASPPGDMSGIGNSTAMLRATRDGRGTGRTYTISFTASDGNGGEADGSVEVVVPHDQGDQGRGKAKGPR